MKLVTLINEDSLLKRALVRITSSIMNQETGEYDNYDTTPAKAQANDSVFFNTSDESVIAEQAFMLHKQLVKRNLTLVACITGKLQAIDSETYGRSYRTYIVPYVN